MSNLIDLQKLLNKSSNYTEEQQQKSLKHSLIKALYNIYQKELINNKNIEREILFLTMYYGIIEETKTLESIGNDQPQKLTRERVRQIINSTLSLLNISDINPDNPYYKSKIKIKELLLTSDYKFLPLKDLLETSYFSSFKKNSKGIISFLNDCGIKQITYRKDFYIYLPQENRSDIIKEIQKYQKTLRKNNTIKNMEQKSKTVTYIPNEVKIFLNTKATESKIKLNELYQIIFNDFISKNPYKDLSYSFGKTKSWQSRKGLANWEQIGIYIEKNLFNQLKTIVKKLKSQNPKISFMSFISQSFIWYYNQQQTT